MSFMEYGKPVPRALRIYISGPHTARCDLDRLANMVIAARVGLSLVLKGHDAHVPHTAEAFWQRLVPQRHCLGRRITMIDRWAQALYVAERCAASDREVAAAHARGLPVYSTINEVPTVPGARISRNLERELESPQCLDWLYRELNLGPANDAVSRHLLRGGTVARLERALFERVAIGRVVASVTGRARAS